MKKLRYNFNKSNYQPNTMAVNSYYYSPSIISEFLFSSSDDGVYSYHSDVSLLFHSERIKNQIDSENVRSWLDDIRQNLQYSSEDLNKGLSDEDILYFTKSKDIQSYAELRAWYSHLMKDCNNAKKGLKYYIDNLRKSSDKKDSVSNSKTD